MNAELIKLYQKSLHLHGIAKETDGWMEWMAAEKADRDFRAQMNGGLYDANPECEHSIVVKPSGVICRRCDGWFCH